MTKITQIDKATCRAIAADVEQALKAVAEKHGLAVAYRGGNFTSSNFSPKIEFSVIGDGGTALTREAEDFKRYAAMYGLFVDDLGATVTLGGRALTICGLKPRAGRLPILAKAADGRTYKCNAQDVARALGRVPQ